MLFSVLVPVYNVEKYLGKCIESVLNQTYRDFELILVDDGSTDNSGKICDEYANKNDCIKVFHKKNQGLLHTRSYALERASGEWFVFLDSDDYLELNALQTIYNTICKYDCDCVIYNLQSVLDGQVIGTFNSAACNADLVITEKKELFQLIFGDWAYNSLCRKACKATLFDGRDYSRYYGVVNNAEDLLRTIEIVENASKVVLIDSILYNYRVNFDSMSRSIALRLDHYENVFIPPEKAMQAIDKSGLFDHSDYKEMYNCHLEMFFYTLGYICGSKNKTKDIIAVFKRIKNHDYYLRLKRAYKANVFRNGKRRFMFGLFNRGYYRLYVYVFRLYSSFCKTMRR